MTVTKRFWILGREFVVLLAVLLAACAPAAAPVSAPALTDTPLPPATADLPPTPEQADPTPQAEATSRGPALVSSDPSALAVGAGLPVLIEFFRFT